MRPAHPTPGRRRSSLTFALAGAAWVTAVGLGFAVLWDHAARPGVAAHPPATWPADSRIPRVPGRPTLVLLAHPRCPCTRATLAELAKLLGQVNERMTTSVAFIRPEEAPTDWQKTDIWESAAAMPGVHVLLDDGGAEARRFGAVTSGQALLYDAAGHLAFSGGITSARGHEGDNSGRATLQALLTAGGVGTATPVFGCTLATPTES